MPITMFPCVSYSWSLFVATIQTSVILSWYFHRIKFWPEKRISQKQEVHSKVKKRKKTVKGKDYSPKHAGQTRSFSFWKEMMLLFFYRKIMSYLWHACFTFLYHLQES